MTSSKKEHLLFACLLGSALLLATTVARAADAPNLLRNGDAELGNADNWGKLWEARAEGAHAGKSCFIKAGPAFVLCDDFIAVDPDKTYLLSGWFKSATAEPSHLYFGYAPYDADKKPIFCENVSATPGTETTLAGACKKEDDILKIADGSKWRATPFAVVAFSVDNSGQYKDLPNRNLSTRGILSVDKKGEFWEIKLAKPCGKEYPAGTLIRQHVAGPGYIYNAATNAVVPQEWKQYSGRIKGIALSGAPTAQWWPGAKFARVIVMPNYGQAKDVSLLADDISMTTVEP